jgi:glycerophosphoryl diester phosphodiesterase
MKNYIIFSVLIILAMNQVTGQSPVIIAHRGASFEAPENTLASVNLAWEQNADAVEIDVYLSKDNKIMVIHDKDTKRTAGEKLVVKESMASDLRKLDVGSFKSPDYKGEKIPFLSEVIETIPEGKKLIVEVKCGTEILPFLKESFINSGKIGQLVIISFDFDVVAGAKKIMPEVPVYWLHFNLAGEYNTKWIEKAREADLDGLNFRYKGISEEFIKSVHDANMEIYAWTVDDPEEAAKLCGFGIDGITTNRPGWMKSELDKISDR